MAEESKATTGDDEAGEDALGFGGERGSRSNPPVIGLTDPSSAAKESAPKAYHRQRSFDAGDLPEGMEARYLIERRRLTGEQRYYENASDTKPAFRDRGDRLVADNDSRVLIRDMLDIAEHRGWDRIRVSGSETFRRAAWREAALRGLEVDGYTPKPRELQDVARSRSRRDARAGAIARDVERGQQEQRGTVDRGRNERNDRPVRRADFDVGVSGRLIDVGEARYGGTARGKVTPYADIVGEDGRRERAWGVGLPAALRESGVVVGDQATVRRLGTERVQVTVAILNPDTGERGSETREVNRNRWSVERILTADLIRGSRATEAAIPAADSALMDSTRPRTHEIPGERRRNPTATDTRGAQRTVDVGDDQSGVRTSPGFKPNERHSQALADRFRNSTSAEAARDPELQAAQSQFVAAKAILISTLGHEPIAAERLIARSRETIARAIEQGRAIPAAELRGDRKVAPDRERQPPERTRGGDRSTEVPSVSKAPSRSRAR